jgi:UDP-3-O-[3-hydroxymyristoyl] glucosamine N-acyltransferase
MSDPVFFTPAGSLSLAEIAAIIGADLAPETPPLSIEGVAPLEYAGPRDIAYMDNARYGPALAQTRAAACIVSRRFAANVPSGTVSLVVAEPYRAYAAVLTRLHADALRPRSMFGGGGGVSPGSVVHASARLEDDVDVDPGAVIGAGAEIGRGSVVAAGAVVGPNCRIGRDCSIGAGATVANSFLGNRVTLHPGVRVGQDGFGYAFGSGRHAKVPQVGRVILQDDVEVGANTTIDRGAIRDTVVGEGTKIDNLVQIAHNVVIGRHCIIVAQCGIAGSATLEDYVVLGGQVAVIGHVRIGAGAQIAATAPSTATCLPARAGAARPPGRCATGFAR